MRIKSGRFWVASATAVVLGLLPQAVAAQEWRMQPVTAGAAGGLEPLAVVDLRGGGQMQVLCQWEDFSISVQLPFRINAAETTDVTLMVPSRAPELQQWQVEAEGRSILASSPMVLARHIIAGRAPVLELPAPRGRTRTLSVPVGASASLLGRVMETCGQNPADLEAIVPGIDPQVIAFVDQASNIDGYRLRNAFLGQQRLESLSPRPTELYESMGRFWRETFPALCLDPAGDYHSMPSCAAVREARATHPAAPIPVALDQGLAEFWQRELELAQTGAASLASASAQRNSCGRPDTPPRLLSRFPIERAYPRTAIERSLQGTVVALVSVDATGAVTGVEFASAHPAGVFESAVEREIRTLRFEPGTSNCEPVAGTVALPITFRLMH